MVCGYHPIAVWPEIRKQGDAHTVFRYSWPPAAVAGLYFSASQTEGRVSFSLLHSACCQSLLNRVPASPEDCAFSLSRLCAAVSTSQMPQTLHESFLLVQIERMYFSSK